MKRCSFSMFVAAFVGLQVMNPPVLQAQMCDPVEKIKLLSFDSAKGDEFGRSAAVSGDVLIVGAPGDDDNGFASGSAYIFRYDGAAWNLQVKLVAPDGKGGREFGRGVAISGDVALIGSTRDRPSGFRSGSVFVYRFDGADWRLETKLVPSDGRERQYFGNPIAISGNVAVVGVFFDDVNGRFSGSVYVFRYDGAEWIEEAKLVPPDGAADDFFGARIAVDGDTIAVGARGKGDLGDDSGAVYVYRYDDSEWVNEAVLHASDGGEGDLFSAVGIAGNTIMVGALEAPGQYLRRGAVYVFEYMSEQWVETSKLVSPQQVTNSYFGSEVAMSGEVAAITVSHQDSPVGSEWVHVYRFDGTDWVADGEVHAFEAREFDYFGEVLAVSQETIVVGAYNDKQNGNRSGSVYVFDAENDCCLDLDVSNVRVDQLAEFRVSGGTPGARCMTVVGLDRKRNNINDAYGFCGSFSIGGVRQSSSIIGGTNRRFGANGNVRFTWLVPNKARSHELRFQSAEHGTCPDQCMSNLVEIVAH